MTDSGLKEFRHKLIQEEMRDQLTSNEYVVPVETDGIVVLSATPWKDKDGKPYEDSPEARARVNFAIEVLKQIAAKKSGKTFEEISAEDITQYSPPLFLDGATEQLPVYEKIAKEAGFPDGKVQLIDCGSETTANTKTQFKVMDKDPRFQKVKHLTFITSDYHMPRAERTEEKNLNPNIHPDFISVPHSRFNYDVFSKVRGEVKRIINYSAKGDIAREIKSS